MSRYPAIMIAMAGLETLKPTPIFDAYWRFAAERQRMLYRRMRNDLVLTEDPVLSCHRFTNAYRVTDRVSQYLVSNVIPNSDARVEDRFFRILLFKIFNKIETWKTIVENLGEPHLGTTSWTSLENILSMAKERGERIYSAAYIMPIPAFGEKTKHANHLRLLEWMIEENFPARWASSKNLRDVYELLLGARSFGPFLAFQYAIDLGYDTVAAHDESAFVVAGPGARGGIAKCFSDYKGWTSEDVIMRVTAAQDEEFEKRGIDFLNLYGRKLQPIDCQNLFCEIDKYARVAFPESTPENGRTQIKQIYRYGASALAPMRLPAAWNVTVNEEHGMDVAYVYAS